MKRQFAINGEYLVFGNCCVLDREGTREFIREVYHMIDYRLIYTPTSVLLPQPTTNIQLGPNSRDAVSGFDVKNAK